MKSAVRSRTKRSVRAFGLAVVAVLSIGALTASSASALSLTPVSGTYPVTLSSAAEWGTAQFNYSKEASVKCKGASAAGKLTSGTTGEITFTFTGCGTATSSCTTPGQPAGNMVAKTNITPVYLNAAKTIWGFKYDPIGSNVFAACQFPPSVGWEWRFTGSVLSTSSGAIGETTNIFNPHFGWGNLWNEQQYQQIEGAGTKYHLNLAGFTSEGGEWPFGESALWRQFTLVSSTKLKIEA